MRIVQLDLKAFGHFTNRPISFEDGPDFHIAYGPNEAGKTTMSRALKAALFGVPERTTDNHLHPNPSMRVGVVLVLANGERLAAMRRKGRKNSLVTYDPLTGEELGIAIPDEQLAAWMGGLSEGLYTSMFGLDHDELVAGGKALSEGKGELGQSLFEAGAGLSSIRDLRERLTKEAEELFKPRAASTAIFKSLGQYNDARKEAKEAQTKPAEWETLRATAENAKAAYDGIRTQQEELQKEVRRLDRLAAVLPDVAARSLVMERLSILGEVTRLPAEASNERLAEETRLQQATLAHEDAVANVAQQQAELDSIVLPQSLLEEGASIETLYYELTAFRASREMVANANGRIAQASVQTDLLLAAIGESLQVDLRSLIPSATLRARVQSLVTKGARLQAELDAATRLSNVTKKELDDLVDEIAEVGLLTVPASVVEVLQDFEAQGNPESKVGELAQQVAKTKATLVRDAAALTAGAMEALVVMGTPLPAELQRFRTDREDLDAQKKLLQGKIEGLEDDLADVNGEIEGLMRQGDVPTAEHLAEQRGLRESLWQKIRRKVFPDTTEGEGDDTLPTPVEYEFAVQVADSTADSRFADAARVSQHADLLKRQAQMVNAIELEHGRLEVVGKGTNELKLKWQSLIDKYGLPSLSVAELTDWLAKRDLFLQRYQTYEETQSQAAAAAERTATVRTSLSAALSEAGLPACGDKEALTLAIGRTRALVDQANQGAASQKVLARKHKGAEGKLAEANAQIEGCEKLLEEWRTGWTEAMTAIRLASDAGGEEASARLGQFDALEDALDTLDGARADLATAQTTVTRIEQELARLSEATAYDRANRPADAVIEMLHERLTAAKELAQRCKTLEGQIKEANKAGTQATQSVRLAEQELAKLKSAAGCETLDELVDAENRSAECLRLENDLTEIEARLVTASALPLQDLLVQADGQDLVLVQSALDRISIDMCDCTPKVEALHQKQLETQAALDLVDGEAIAAEAEQRAADAAARLSNQVADYSSARLASAILSEAIETYQQRYQGPLLARASELFATITCGRFDKVATDFDEDMTILVGVRPNGKRETVGNLSSGTRDQLFLALRLAAIESHVANQEPMPVVVDDIVINFDDASSSATFKVLAELSKKTQVLFFTHHEHLLERAASAIGNGVFTSHKL
jgi:DNA repair protein SbcC/Rad50